MLSSLADLVVGHDWTSWSSVVMVAAAEVVVTILLLSAFALYHSSWSWSKKERSLWAIPGPKSYAVSSIPLAYAAWQARSVQTIYQLHQKYGPVVRVAPNQISFNSLTGLRTIYGAGSAFERTSFYSMFDVYGRPNLFTFASGIEHRERKRLISRMYSNQNVLGNAYYTRLIRNKVAGFLALIENEPDVASEIFSSLHYFSLDAISEFVYGPSQRGGHGEEEHEGDKAPAAAPAPAPAPAGTQALSSGHANVKDREMICDILDPHRRRLSWFLVHFPGLTRFLVSRTGLVERVLNRVGLMPMKKPFTYTGIRKHALEAFHYFNSLSVDEQARYADTTVIGRLFAVRAKELKGAKEAKSKKDQPQAWLSNMDIASECADHLLAGIDTTADSMLFLIWVLSLPENEKYQDQLRDELLALPQPQQPQPQQQPQNSSFIDEPRTLTQLPLINAVLKEALRLYTPLPVFEPRSCPVDTVIDGYHIPAGTVVGMSPYCLHRESSVFGDPLAFRPERWLVDQEPLPQQQQQQQRLIAESDIKNRYFWAFSSGARMCIGMHLANAEMLTLTAALYRKYKTVARQPDTTPAITSRYEIFRDESRQKMQEHECWVDFVKI